MDKRLPPDPGSGKLHGRANGGCSKHKKQKKPYPSPGHVRNSTTRNANDKIQEAEGDKWYEDACLLNKVEENYHRVFKGLKKLPFTASELARL